MKKLITFALSIAAIGSMSAQKANVEAAKKLSGKPDQIEEARKLIQQAIENPETADQAQTYFIAGKIEYDAYDKDSGLKMVNPASVDPVKMATNLLNGYKMFVKAIPLTDIPNEKGKTDAKTKKDIIGKLKGHTNDYFQAGVDFFNAQKIYPEAYETLMIFAEMPDQEFMKEEKIEIADADRALAYFNAGLAALNGQDFLKGAEAFRKSQNSGYPEKEAYVYEIACWQNLAMRDSTMEQTAKEKINEVAIVGDQKYGMAEPIFISNIVNFLVLDKKYDEAVSAVSERIASNPENPALYGLRGFVYDRQGNDEASVNDYRKAAATDGVDFETLKNAAKKIFRVGADKWNAIEGGGEEANNARKDVKENYFQAAKAITDKAKALNASDGDLDYVIENIDYMLSLAN